MANTKEFELLMKTIEGLKKKMRERVTDRLLEDEAMVIARELAGFAAKFKDAAKKLKEQRKAAVSQFMNESR